MSHILKTIPFTRINDRFSVDDRIDASPITKSVRHPYIQTPPRTSTRGMFQPDFYQHIACDIVTETVFDYPYPYITEKTLRPIACKRMFIIVGSYGILSHLKNKGFFTFDDFINEEYDAILDPIERFHAVIGQVHKFCNRSLDEIVQYLKNNKNKFDHNFDNLMSLQEKELSELKQKLQ